MSLKTQRENMKTISSLISQELGYIFGERESGPNGAKKIFHDKSSAFLRALGSDLGFIDYKVTRNYGGIAVSGEITLMGMWSEGNGLYLQISQPITQQREFLYRHITHMKDYCGGSNQWLPCDIFTYGDYKNLLGLLLSLRDTSKEKSHAA